MVPAMNKLNTRKNIRPPFSSSPQQSSGSALVVTNSLHLFALTVPRSPTRYRYVSSIRILSCFLLSPAPSPPSEHRPFSHRTFSSHPPVAHIAGPSPQSRTEISRLNIASVFSPYLSASVAPHASLFAHQSTHQQQFSQPTQCPPSPSLRPTARPFSTTTSPVLR